MGTWSKIVLSGTNDGSAITVGTTVQTVHTAVTGVGGALDEVWLYAYRYVGNSSLIVTFGTDTFTYFATLGGAANPANLNTVLPGIPLRNALTVKCQATTGATWVVCGFVNRYTT